MTASAIASPCVDVCRMDARHGLCVGCARTIEEIAAWSAFDDAGRHTVLARAAARRADGFGAGTVSAAGEDGPAAQDGAA